MTLKIFKYEIKDEVKVNEKAKGGMPSFVGRVGTIVDVLHHGSFDYEVYFDKHTTGKFKEEELDLYVFGSNIDEREQGRFEKIATELGKFTDKKNKQYGSSVDATYEMMKVLMERYKNEDDTYTIPQSLLKHILLQVRMMDKINRIFNNPSGKGDSESPYKDLAGYSLIGVDMVENNKK